jgi:hypothetical protein
MGGLKNFAGFLSNGEKEVGGGVLAFIFMSLTAITG